jgi:hypothetical protein
VREAEQVVEIGGLPDLPPQAVEDRDGLGVSLLLGGARW